jgi:hypothetical protein
MTTLSVTKNHTKPYRNTSSIILQNGVMINSILEFKEYKKPFKPDKKPAPPV